MEFGLEKEELGKKVGRLERVGCRDVPGAGSRSHHSFHLVQTFCILSG